MVYNRNCREPMSSAMIQPDRITFHVYKFYRNHYDNIHVAASLSDTLEELKVKILKRLNITCSPDTWRLIKYDEKSGIWTHVDNSNPFATIDRLGLEAFRTLSIERCPQQSAIEQSSQHLSLKNNMDLRLSLKLKDLSETISPLMKNPMITLGQLRKEVWQDFGDSSKSQSIYLWREDHWEKLESNMDNKTLADLKFVSGTLISLSIDEESIESKPPCGLSNLVNTCFMNSALQCLISIPEWTEQVLALTGTRKAPILNEYIKLITEMRSGKYETIRPSSLFLNISDNLPRYSHYRQQDAQEFMNYFLHLIHQELQARETLITNLFYGKMRSSVTCLQCDRTETTDESISFLPLPMSNDNRKIVLLVKADGELRHLSIKINPSTVTVGDLINCFLNQNGVVVTPDLILVELSENRVLRVLNSRNYIKYEDERRLAFLERPTRIADDKYILCHFVNRTTYERFRPPVYVTCPKIQTRYTDLFDQIQQLCGHLCSATDAPITACGLYWIDDSKHPYPLSAETSKDKSLAYISEFHIVMDTKWVDIYKDYCKNNNSKENSSLISLLDDFFREELLDGKYHCSTCPKSTQARQKSDLCLPLPKVLIVQLKRFTYDISSNEKIDTFISFPLHDLDLGQYVIKDNDNPNQNTSSTKYDLVAVSNHTGSLIGGHYTTYAKNIQNQDHWYLFDDSYVRKLHNNNDVVTKNAYILVYVRKS